MFTSVPSKRKSRGSRTAWLRPLRNNLATPVSAMGNFLLIKYIPLIDTIDSIFDIYQKLASNQRNLATAMYSIACRFGNVPRGTLCRFSTQAFIGQECPTH